MNTKLKKKYYPLWLQRFADGDGGDGGTGGGSGEGGSAGSGAGDGGTGGENPPSFDDFLRGDGNQAEFDRRVNRAIETAVKNAKDKWQALTDDKLSEAEKLAKMTEKEKTDYRNAQLEKEIAQLKRQNSVADMAKTARAMLADEEIVISDELLANLISDDAEKTKTAVDSFTKLFKTAVQNAVKDALKGKNPRGSGEKTITKEQIMAITDPTERQNLIAKNIDLFQK